MYNSAASQLSNNPFIDDPSNSAGRFPDIGTLERSSSGYTSPGPSSYAASNYSTGYPQQTAYGMQPQPQQQQYLQPTPIQQQQSYSGWQQPQGASSPYGGYASPLGNGSMSPQMTGMPYQNTYSNGMLQQYPQQQYSGYASPQYDGASYPGYGGQQQGYGPQQPPPSALEFDPLKPLNTSFNPGPGPGGQTHPKEYIRTHKQELEMWDNVTWKQALNSFDALRAAWELHKTQITSRLSQGPYVLGPVEAQRLQGLQKDADNNIDTVAASSLQMQEALSGYRQSADLASKNRVRESLNAAVVNLPDWPPQSW